MKGAVLLVNKPKGISSAKVVALIRKRFDQKAGHAGTLDPLATGLLIVLLGDKTKEAAKFLGLPKVYEVSGRLGIATNTYDMEGKVVSTNNGRVTKAALKKALKSIASQTTQLPPPFSAKKIKGVRAYQMARKGEKVELAPQAVQVYSLKLLAYDYPRFKLQMTVSSGFYVRSFIHDLGQQLGVGAVVEEIKRLKIGRYSLKEAKDLATLLGSEAKTLAANQA